MSAANVTTHCGLRGTNQIYPDHVDFLLDERTLAYLDLSTASGVTGRKLYLGENYGHLHEQKSCTTFANEGEPFFPMDHTTCFDLDTDEPLRCVDVTTGQNAVSFADYVGGVTNVPKVCQYAAVSTAKNHFLGWTHQDMMAVNPPASWAMSRPGTYGDNEALSGCITFRSEACATAADAGNYDTFSVLILRGAETAPDSGTDYRPTTAAPTAATAAPSLARQRTADERHLAWHQQRQQMCTCFPQWVQQVAPPGNT